MSRKNIKVHKQTYDALREGKQDGETWDEYLVRLRKFDKAVSIDDGGDSDA